MVQYTVQYAAGSRVVRYTCRVVQDARCKWWDSFKSRVVVVVTDWVREGREGGGGRYVSSLDGACEGTKAYDGHAEFAVWTDEFCFWEGERERER